MLKKENQPIKISSLCIYTAIADEKRIDHGLCVVILFSVNKFGFIDINYDLIQLSPIATYAAVQGGYLIENVE